MSLNSYLIGGVIALVARFVVVDAITEVETPTDPTTIEFSVRRPDGSLFQVTVPDLAISHVGPGIYVYTFVPPASGRYKCRVEGTGACQAASETTFEIEESVVL